MSAAQVVTRLIQGVVVVVAVSVLAFLLVHLVPGDVANTIAGDEATVEDVERIREELGLDDPLPVQYGRWVAAAARGDLGTSLITGRPVMETLLRNSPPTLTIAGLALLFSVVVGTTSGMVAGLREGSWIDRIVSGLTTLGIAMPSFWFAMLLVIVFALNNPWLPATGYASPSAGLLTWFKHAIIPAVALGLAPAAELARQARAGVRAVLARPYIRTARARGASTAWLVRHHVLRNAAIPVVTVVGLQARRLIGGSVVIEAVMGISGIGSLAISAVFQNDYAIVQAFVLFTAIIVVGLNLLVDLSYGWINPRTGRA